MAQTIHIKRMHPTTSVRRQNNELSKERLPGFTVPLFNGLKGGKGRGVCVDVGALEMPTKSGCGGLA